MRIQLPSVLHRVWPSCTVNRQLLLAVVSLINVYAAQHSQGTRIIKRATCLKVTCKLHGPSIYHPIIDLYCTHYPLKILLCYNNNSNNTTTTIIIIIVWSVCDFLSGRVSLASSSKGTSSLFQDVLKHTSHSLSCYQSCVSSKIVNPHAEVLGPLFSLLANSSLSQECRAIMKRVR